jgi:hypothetical protein
MSALLAMQTRGDGIGGPIAKSRHAKQNSTVCRPDSNQAGP